MFPYQGENVPKSPTDPNQDPLRTWKSWKHEHPEFNRTEYSIATFEGKVLIVGGNLEVEDQRAVNLILIDPESQKFQIIQPVGADAQFDCNSSMSVCYWKDSKIVVFGGYDYYGREQCSSAVAVITFKDLDSENPSAHWEKMVPPTQLFRYRHSAHIHEDKMYVCGGWDENENRKHDAWCLDLTDFTWSEFKFKCVNSRPEEDYYIPEGSGIFHENKAFFWDYATIENLTLMELDLSKKAHLLYFKMTIDARSARLFLVPRIELKNLYTQFCPQLINQKIFYLTSPMNVQHHNSAKLQVWTLDLDLKMWAEVKASESIPISNGDPGRSLLFCNNHLVCYRKCEEGTDPFFCEVWSLPLDLPKTTSTTILSKTQQTLKDFFFEAPYSDISFEVGSEVIKAHKWWLIQRNKFFANMFASGMSEAQASTIKITDMKASTFKALLEFLYSDHVELDNSLAFDLLQQADKYSIGELKNACEKHLISNIKPENYVALGQIAELIGAATLRDAVVAFIANNMKEVRQRKDFNDISDALLRDSLVKFIVK